MSMPTCSSCIYAQGICEKTGVKIHYSTGCTYYNTKPMTNADRIRAMTDEELAEFLERVADGCDSCPMLKECTYSDEEISEKQIRLKWLKQEAEDG